MSNNNLYTKETYTNKEDWLKNRGLGGTSASVITGNSPYKNILELFTEIVCPTTKDVETTNESMNYGTECEPIIRKLFAIDFAKKYTVHTPEGMEMYRRIDKPYMTATLDSVLTENETGRKGVHEIKTHDIKNKDDELDWKDHIPQNYYEQVIWYLVVLPDFEFVELTAKLNFYDYFDPSGKKLKKTEIHYYHIERKDVAKDIKNLEKMVTRFWEKNVNGGIIPEMKISF